MDMIASWGKEELTLENLVYFIHKLYLIYRVNLFNQLKVFIIIP